jgi:DNA polymerase-3 subunit epsilon
LTLFDQTSSATNLVLTRPLAFFDLETTGIDNTNDKIIEIAILKLHPNGQIENYHQVCNPGRPIPKESSAIHGFTDEAVKDKPLFKELAKEIDVFLKDCDFAGFNSNRFDIPLLVEEMLRVDIDLEIEKRQAVDVQRIYHKLERRNLEAAYLFYCGKNLENAHSAMADVQATYEILLAQIARYKELENNVEFLTNFSEDGKFIDVARRLIEKNGRICFNFGKYKDQAVEEVLRKEPNYYDWVMKSDFPLHTKLKLKAIKTAMN